MTFLAGELAARIRLDGKDAFDRGLSESGGKFSALEGLATKAGNGIAAGFKVASGMLATFAVAAGGAATAAFMSAARVGELDVAMQAVGKSTGVGYAALTNTANAIKAQGIEMGTAQKMALQFAQSNLNLSDAAKVARVAQDLAVISGKNSTDQTNVLIAAVQTQQVELLRSAGITKGVQEGFDIYAKTLGKSATDLTAVEKKQAIVNLILQEGGKVAGTYEAAMGSASKVLRSFPRLANDIAVAVGTPMTNAFGPSILAAYQLAKAFDAAVSPGGKLAPLVDYLGNALIKFTLPLKDAINETRRWMNGLQVTAPTLQLIGEKMRQLGTYAPAIASVGAAMLAFGGASIPIIGRFLPVLNPVVAGILALVATSPALRKAGLGLVDALKPLIPVAVQLATVLATGLNSALPLVANGVTLLAGVLTPAVRLLASVPGPVLAGVAAFIALRVLMNPLTLQTGLLSMAFKGFGESMALQTALAGASGVQLSTMGAMAAVAGTRITGLGLAIKSAFISNPIGLALTLITTVIGLFITANADAAAAVDAHKNSVETLRLTLDAGTAATTAATRAQQAKDLIQSDAAKSLAKLGIESNKYVDALGGQKAANMEVRDTLAGSSKEHLISAGIYNKVSEQARILGVSVETLISSSYGNAKAQKEVSAAFEGMATSGVRTTGSLGGLQEQIRNAAPDTAKLTKYLDDQQKVLGDARKAAADYRDAMAQQAATAGEAALSNGRLNDAIAIARDTSKDAAARLQALKQALDELKGGSQTTAQAAADLSSKSLDLKDAFNQTDAAGNKLGTSMVDAGGKIDVTSRQGIALFNTVNSINDAMLGAIQSAVDLSKAQGDDLPTQQAKAIAAAEPFLKSISDQGGAAQLTAEQIGGLIAQYTAVPQTVVTLLTDNGTISITEQNMIRLAAQINATPNKTVVVDEPFSPEIMARMGALGFIVSTLPNGKIQVVAQGIANVESALTALVNKPRTVKVNLYMPNIPGNGSMLRVDQNNANGGFYNRGVKAFANGGAMDYVNQGVPTGVYAGRPGGILKFAEPEVGWEAYVSGKPGQEDRNRSILTDAAERLGMHVVKTGAQRPTAFANGGFMGGGFPPAAPAPAVAATPVGSVASRNVEFNMHVYNPVARDPIQDIRVAGQAMTAAFDV